MVGKVIAYKSIGINGEKTSFAKVESREFHEGLNKMIYNCVSSKGNKFRLTIDEIKFVVH